MNTQQWRIPAHVPQNHGCRSLDASRTVANLLPESDGLKHPPLGGESGAGNSLKHSGLENLFHDLRRCSKIPRCILPISSRGDLCCCHRNVKEMSLFCSDEIPRAKHAVSTPCRNIPHGTAVFRERARTRSRVRWAMLKFGGPFDCTDLTRI